MRLLAIILLSIVMIPKVWSGNWNGGSSSLGKAGRINEGASASLEDYRASFLQYYNGDKNRFSRFTVKGSESPRAIQGVLTEDDFVTSQLNRTGLLSYLLLIDGELVVDEISPPDRLGDILKSGETVFNSQSVGKSVVSYLLGHAICQGYIKGLDATLDDWPLISNTLYSDQSLSVLVNMSAGDARYFKNATGRVNGSKGNINSVPISSWASALQGTKPGKGLFGKKSFNYHSFLPNLIHNYIAYKTGNQYEAFLQSVFQHHVKIERDAFFLKQYAPMAEGPLRSTFFATRYDYLRFAMTILEDWRNDTCVGKYLKELYDRRVKNAYNPRGGHGLFRSKTHSKGTNYDYAGFFHTNPAGGIGTIFVMHGYGGQVIAINFDTGTIVVAHSVHEDWDTGRLIIDAVNQ